MSNNGTRKRSLPSAPRGKPRKPRKQLSEDEDSNDSVTSEPREQQRTPSPMGDEPTVKLPEELLKTFYKTPGVLMIAGLVSWDLTAKKENATVRTHPNLYTFHRLTDRKYRLIVSSCSAGHSILVGEDGTAYTFGRNGSGQLGFGDTTTRNVPEAVPALQGMNIIHAAVGRHHSLFVTDTGTVYACGDNKSGQCGLGTNSPQVLKPTRIRYTGKPIVKVGCGAEFSMILDCNGGLHSFGLPEYGQLGHNTDGKYFVTSTKLSYHFETVPKHVALFFEKTKDGHVVPVKDVDIVDFSCGNNHTTVPKHVALFFEKTKDGHVVPVKDVDIVDFSCENNHTVAIDSKKRAYSWGFGGFGRLGHAEQKDESVPRLIKYFGTSARGVRSVHCGSTYSLAVNEIGTLFLFGQTKRTGEANMYPKPVQDLTGWNIRSIGTSNTSVVIAADDSLIAWGVSPTYGELGTGEITKSTAKPKEVTRMEGTNVSQVTMGYSHTLLLCDDSTDAAKQKIATMPVFDP